MIDDELAVRREARDGRPNLACSCGSQWWTVTAVTFGPHDGEHLPVTGYAFPVSCHECGRTLTP